MKILQVNDTHKGFTRNTDKIHQKFFQEVKQQDFDILIHCGDMIAHQQKNVRQTFKQLRWAAGDKPVAAVRGNHDFWQDYKYPDQRSKYGYKDVVEILDQHREWAAEENITLLDEGRTIETDNVFIGGFLTWYRHDSSHSNDFVWMDYLLQDCTPTGDYLRSLQEKTVYDLKAKLEANVGKARVVVSHMPCFGELFDQKYTCDYHIQLDLKWNAEYYMFGHSHRLYTGEVCFGDTKAYQTGSDYDKPKHHIVEVKQ